MLKHTACAIAPQLSTLFNLSLPSGIVPTDWKLSNVTPVYKAGDPKLVSNYRPISLLSLPSKLLERFVNNKLLHYLLSNLLLSHTKRPSFQPPPTGTPCLIRRRMLQRSSLIYPKHHSPCWYTECPLRSWNFWSSSKVVFQLLVKPTPVCGAQWFHLLSSRHHLWSPPGFYLGPPLVHSVHGLHQLCASIPNSLFMQMTSCCTVLSGRHLMYPLCNLMLTPSPSGLPCLVSGSM